MRPEFGGTEYRIFFGRQGETFVLLHAIMKKQQKVSRNDIILARRRFNEWKGRNGYEDEL